MQLIGINGFKRSGKNTVGEIIRDSNPDVHVHLVGFADKLKIAAARALGFVDGNERELIDLMDEFKESAQLSIFYRKDRDSLSTAHLISGRQYLQFFGTEAGRETFSDSFWIDLVLPNPAMQEGWIQAGEEQLERMYPGVDILVVTDVRFDNEARRVKSLGGQVWEVVRPGVDGGSHSSERPLARDLIDLTIQNDADLEGLEQKVKEALNADS